MLKGATRVQKSQALGQECSERMVQKRIEATWMWQNRAAPLCHVFPFPLTQINTVATTFDGARISFPKHVVEYVFLLYPNEINNLEVFGGIFQFNYGASSTQGTKRPKEFLIIPSIKIFNVEGIKQQYLRRKTRKKKVTSNSNGRRNSVCPFLKKQFDD